MALHVSSCNQSFFGTDIMKASNLFESYVYAGSGTKSKKTRNILIIKVLLAHFSRLA